MPKKGEYENLQGNTYNYLHVDSLNRHEGRRTYWNCTCKCGNKSIVESSKLKGGYTKSCGCYSRELIRNVNRKTGMSRSRLYSTYRNMLNRCYRAKGKFYHHYGGRGITVCDEWLGENGFENFMYWSMKNGYSEELSIDRIDNNKGYSPDNCRWVDLFIQANNKRNTKYISINGVVDTVANHSRKYGISYWNLLHYAKGGKNCCYPDLVIEVPNGL